MEITKTYIEYLYPGTLFSESETKETKTRNTSKVEVPENAFGFRFFDRTSKEITIDGEKQKAWGKPKNKSGVYYPGGRLYTLEQIKKLGKNYSILASNMENNDWLVVVKTRMGNFQPFEKGDRII